MCLLRVVRIFLHCNTLVVNIVSALHVVVLSLFGKIFPPTSPVYVCVVNVSRCMYVCGIVYVC